MDFKDWLQEKKNLKGRSAQDVESRLKRVIKILCIKKVTKNTLKNLENDEDFLALTVSVRSQLRRSVRLYLEYELENSSIIKE